MAWFNFNSSKQDVDDALQGITYLGNIERLEDLPTIEDDPTLTEGTMIFVDDAQSIKVRFRDFVKSAIKAFGLIFFLSR